MVKNPNAHLFSKNSKKFLTKIQNCGIITPLTRSEGKSTEKIKNLKKSSKKSLTKIQKHDIITPLMRSKSKSTRQGKGGKSQPLYI